MCGRNGVCFRCKPRHDNCDDTIRVAPPACQGTLYNPYPRVVVQPQHHDSYDHHDSHHDSHHDNHHRKHHHGHH